MAEIVSLLREEVEDSFGGVRSSYRSNGGKAFVSTREKVGMSRMYVCMYSGNVVVFFARRRRCGGLGCSCCRDKVVVVQPSCEKKNGR